jgi:hypothetical protein
MLDTHKLTKIEAGLYYYRGVRIFKHRDGFSYYWANHTKEYPMNCKTYPQTLQMTTVAIDQDLNCKNVIAVNGVMLTVKASQVSA